MHMMLPDFMQCLLFAFIQLTTSYSKSSTPSTKTAKMLLRSHMNYTENRTSLQLRSAW